MGKLTITTYLTMDGVMQSPGGRYEDTSGDFTHGGWLVPYVDQAVTDFIAGIFDKAGAFLLGRFTYHALAGYWPRVTDPNDPIASRLNTLPKYVASRTLHNPEWNHSLITRDAVGEMATLKASCERELQVHGSATLAQELMAKDLIDEYRLVVYPVALGTGKRLFAQGEIPAAFRLLDSKTTDRGVLLLSYQRAGTPTYGSF